MHECSLFLFLVYLSDFIIYFINTVSERFVSRVLLKVIMEAPSGHTSAKVRNQGAREADSTAHW